MKPIHFTDGPLQADTYGVDSPRPSIDERAEPFLVVAGKGAKVSVETNDEVPLLFYVDGILGASKVSLQDTISGTFEKRLHAAITQYGLNPEAISVYMGPCLTFSHTHVERKLIEELMDRGYRAACKRTDGVDFLDVPLLLLMQCRKLGVKMENIHISDYDTYENPDLLYSALRGDKENNLTVASLN